MTKLFYDLDVDSYKLSHFAQYPDDVTNISSYIEARSGPNEIVFFGLQMWLQQLDDVVSRWDVDYMKECVIEHGLPFNERMYELCDRPLPLRIQALPEGSIVRPGTCMVQVTNTDPRFPWLTSFVETSLLRAIWYPVTVATKSREIKKVVYHYLHKTGDPSLLPFKLHDFGFRGVSSYESGCIGGLAHLVNFMGTDTMGALKYAMNYYGEPMAGFSIPAAEHSTMTSWGRENESKAYANMVDKFAGPGKLVAVVSDSYDIYNAADQIWGVELKDRVLASGGTVVVRPDSGDPLVVVPKLLEILGDRFGWTNNDKGYRVLNPAVRLIQGDGVNLRMIDSLLGKMQVHGWSADNVGFGMGGALLQSVTRDDFSFAMKASAKSLDSGQTWEGFAKDPITQASKKSKAGRLAVVRIQGGDLLTVAERSLRDSEENLLQDTYVDGKFPVTTTLKEVRELAAVP